MNGLPPVNHNSFLICNPNKNICSFSKKSAPKKNPAFSHADSHRLLARHHCGQGLAEARVDPVVPYLPAPHTVFSRSSMRIQKVSWIIFHSTSINAFIASATVRFIAFYFRPGPRHSRRLCFDLLQQAGAAAKHHHQRHISAIHLSPASTRQPASIHCRQAYVSLFRSKLTGQEGNWTGDGTIYSPDKLVVPVSIWKIIVG
jgi:hypothetical protein